MTAWDDSNPTVRKRRLLQSSRGGGGGGGRREGSYTHSSSFNNDYSSQSASSFSQQSFSFSPLPPSRSGSSTKPDFSSSPPQDWHIIITQQLGRILYGIMSYVMDLLLGTMTILRPLLSFILAISILAICFGALTRGISNIKTDIQTRVICKIPLASYVIRCPSYQDREREGIVHVPDFSDLVKKQETYYELLANSLDTFNPNVANPNAAQQKGGNGEGAGAGKRTKKRDKIKKFFRGKDKGGSSGRNNRGKKPPRDFEEEDSESSTPPTQNDDEDGEEYDDPYGLVSQSLERLPLSLVIKQAELAVVDLKVLVKHSDLTEEPKRLLIDQLQLFHTRAKSTSRQIQYLQSRANGCLDGLAIRNVYLRIELDQLEQGQRLLAMRSISTGVWGFMDRLLDIFIENKGLNVADKEKQLQDLYVSTMDEAQTHIRDLIFRAKEVLQSLDALDNNLITIGEIVTKESKVQNRQYGDVLAQVWTHLGGFQLEKKLHFNNLMLLRGLGGQRKQTVGQVQAALLKLTEFESEIGFLRERVVDASMEASDNNNNGPRTIKNPEDSGSKRLGTLSLKAHIQQIDQVTDRLKARSFLYDAVAEAQWNRVRSIEDGDE